MKSGTLECVALETTQAQENLEKAIKLLLTDSEQYVSREVMDLLQDTIKNIKQASKFITYLKHDLFIKQNIRS